MRIITVLMIFFNLSASPAIGQKKQSPPTQKSNVSQDVHEPRETVTIINNSPPSDNQHENKGQSTGWPSFWDIYWPTVAVVIVTCIAVWSAVKTLRAIQQQVVEMRKTGEQTDKLISENIAQTKSLKEQAQSLARSAYHLGESAAGAHRSAQAMEYIAEQIELSTKAASASVNAINQQMRAYICVVIGHAVFQERTKNLRFQAFPSIVNAGLTPAHKVSFKAAAAILPVPLPEDFDFPLPQATSGASVVGPRQNITVSPLVDGFVDDAEVEVIKSGQGKALYTWGVFTYQDIFGNTRYTKFGQIYTWLADGKTVWGYYTDRHNDSS
jgi:hypothetical protein